MQTALQLPLPKLTGSGLALQHPLEKSADTSILEILTAWDCKLFENKCVCAYTHTKKSLSSNICANNLLGFWKPPMRTEPRCHCQEIACFALSPSFNAVGQTEIFLTSCAHRETTRSWSSCQALGTSMWSSQRCQDKAEARGTGLLADLQWHPSSLSHVQHWAVLRASHTRHVSVPAPADVFPLWMPSSQLKSLHVQAGFCFFLSHATNNSRGYVRTKYPQPSGYNPLAG